MKNIIFLAMSLLPKTIWIDDFVAPDGTVIKDCQSQLEPVVRYIMTKCKGESVTVLSMATTATTELRRIEDEIKSETNGKVVRQRKVLEVKSDDHSQESAHDKNKEKSSLAFFEERIKNSEEYRELASCKFESYSIDLNEPEDAIQKSVTKIKEEQEGFPDEQINLWIDTHGGIRDVALLINIVGYLLDQYTELRISGVYGTVTDTHKIVDQRNAFYSLSFVTGMSDFMNFGNVDVLKNYYNTEISGGDSEIKELISAMQLVSEGTQFCDPYLYTKGLDALSEVIRRHNSGTGNSKNALLPIFYDSILQDYGNLLSGNMRSSLDIIERCVRKKQYQQALTFIEALMPQYFFDKHILYFSEEDLEIAKVASEKSYKSAVSNAFDNFMEKFKNIVSNESDIRNSLSVRAGIFAGKLSAEDFPEDIACKLRKSAPSDLSTGIVESLPIRRKVAVGSVIENGEKKTKKITYKTDVPNTEWTNITRIMQMHNILKNSRNKFNHAVESNNELPISERRPELDHVITVMKTYIFEIHKLENEMNKILS